MNQASSAYTPSSPWRDSETAFSHVPVSFGEEFLFGLRAHPVGDRPRPAGPHGVVSLARGDDRIAVGNDTAFRPRLPEEHLLDFARDRDKPSQPEPVTATEQLAALARLDGVLAMHKVPYWLFGGWAVDFHAGSVTRSHDDLDIAVWSKDHERIAELLATDGWQHTPQEGEDGYTAYTRGTVRLELAFLARDQEGTIYTPLREGRASWPEAAFESDVAELAGVRARVITLAALKAEKSQDRDDPVVAAKDSADVATLSRDT